MKLLEKTFWETGDNLIVTNLLLLIFTCLTSSKS